MNLRLEIGPKLLINLISKCPFILVNKLFQRDFRMHISIKEHIKGLTLLCCGHTCPKRGFQKARTQRALLLYNLDNQSLSYKSYLSSITLRQLFQNVIQTLSMPCIRKNDLNYVLHGSVLISFYFIGGFAIHALKLGILMSRIEPAHELKLETWA